VPPASRIAVDSAPVARVAAIQPKRTGSARRRALVNRAATSPPPLVNATARQLIRAAHTGIHDRSMGRFGGARSWGRPGVNPPAARFGSPFPKRNASVPSCPRNTASLASCPSVADSLTARRWRRQFVGQRSAVSTIRSDRFMVVTETPSQQARSER